MALEFGAVDEVVERLVRGLLAGEDEVVAGLDEPLDHALAGEEIVGQIHRAQRLQARAVLLEPAFDGVALAILLLGAVLFGDELRRERNDLRMSRRDHGRSQHGMIALDLAVAALARLAMRAGDLLAAEILGSVEGDERSAAEPAEGLAHGRFEQQPLRVTQSRARAEPGPRRRACLEYNCRKGSSRCRTGSGSSTGRGPSPAYAERTEKTRSA